VVLTYSVIPTVTASAATSVGSTTATLNGNITADGGAAITDSGFYYSTTSSGELSGTMVSAFTAGQDTGAYSSSISSLTGGTTYYYKAYAVNANGTSYSSETSFSTIGATPPVLTAAGSATVDAPFTITFTDNSTWRGDITGVYVNGTKLTAGYSVSAGQITFTPSASSPANLLQTAATVTIAINSTSFSQDTVSQTIGAGVPAQLVITTQPTAPATDGGALAAQPVVAIEDQYGNPTGGGDTVTAAAVQNTWTLGGTLNVTASSGGVAIFAGLSASDTSAGALNGATIQFSSGAFSVTSAGFNIPAPVIAVWNFENNSIAVNNSPTPSTGTGTASAIGMDSYPTPNVGVTTCDVLQGATGDTGANGIADLTKTWRVRAQAGANGAANGWSSAAPIGAQGAVFTASTVGYNNISVNFDWCLTAAGEANMMLQYTTDGSTWTTVPITIPAAESSSGISSIQNTTSPNTVNGYYVTCNTNITGIIGGANWYTNLSASLPAGAAGSPNFGIRIVNASTGADCVNTTNSPLNNSSGNWRFDNVVITGIPDGPPGPPLTPANNITVNSNSFTITFPSGYSAWLSNLTNITANSYSLPINSSTTNATSITFTMAASSIFQTNGNFTITVGATGYLPDQTVQPIAAGVASQVGIVTQPAGPTGSGGTLVTNPVVGFLDQYGNVTTNGAFGTVTAYPVGSSWLFNTNSGTNVLVVATNGTATFTNLAAINAGSSLLSSAQIHFVSSIGSYSTLNSATFTIPAPPTIGFSATNLAVFQEDVASANSTFSILEVNPVSSSVVNTFPVPATGTNALRTTSAATTGRMALSADGTLVCFTGFETQDGSLVTTPDVTQVTNRGAGTLDAGGNFTLQTSYTGAAANQTRSATTLDNQTWWMGDKGGIYTNTTTGPVVNVAGNNVRSMKTFGGTVYFMQQASGKVVASPISFINPYDSSSSISLGFTFNEPGSPYFESNNLDFYMVQSGQNGSMYDTIYYINGTAAGGISSNPGGITKFYFDGTMNGLSPHFTEVTGSPAVANNLSGDGLCVRTNATTGGFDLFFTTGTGGVAGNSLVMVHDSGDLTHLTLGTPVTNYTASANATLKGVELAPITLVTNIALSSTASTIGVGGTTNLAGLVQILPVNAANQTVTWNSDNIAVATVNAISGVVTGVGTGTVHVYATTTDGSNLSATNLVTVTAPAPTTPIVQTPTTASPIFYSQTLASSTITPGTFTNAAGAAVGISSYGFVNPAIAPNAGSTNVQVYFVPTDTTDYLNATNTVAVTVNTAPAAQLKGAVQVSHGVFAFAFTNFTGLSFSVLATNNLAVPKSSWPVVGTAIEYPAGSGNYQYTNTSATGTNQFYIIRQP